MADLPRYPGIPFWVKVFGIIIIVLVLLFVITKLIGVKHGPNRHTSSRHTGGHTHAIKYVGQQP